MPSRQAIAGAPPNSRTVTSTSSFDRASASMIGRKNRTCGGPARSIQMRNAAPGTRQAIRAAVGVDEFLVPQLECEQAEELPPSILAAAFMLLDQPFDDRQVEVPTLGGPRTQQMLAHEGVERPAEPPIDRCGEAALRALHDFYGQHATCRVLPDVL